MAAAASSVHIKEATVVSPSDQTPATVLSLSALDSQLFLRFTIEYLLVYSPAPPTSDPLATVARIKSALSRSLVPFYPLAGRVRPKQDDSGFLEVVCRGQGAVFIEAVDCHHTIGDFEKAPEYVTQWRKMISLQVADVLKGAPTLVVQLTWLRDGGAALGLGFNHCVCDGIGSAQFLHLFTELTRQPTVPGSSFKPKPIWDRHLMNSTSPRQRQRHARTRFINSELFGRVADLCGFNSRFNNERLVPTSITFDRRCFNELKKLALSSSACRPTGELSACTSFEVLTAHVWRSWARSLNLPPNQIVKLLFSINVRNRVKPSLGGGFYGNAFVLGCAQTSVKDLTEKGLGHATMLVKQAKDRVDDEYVKSVIESVSQRRACPDSTGVLIVSQWSRLGLERVDFGMGKPIHVGPVCCDRFCIFLPVFDQTDAVKVMVAVPTSAVDRYEHLARSLCW